MKQGTIKLNKKHIAIVKTNLNKQKTNMSFIALTHLEKIFSIFIIICLLHIFVIFWHSFSPLMFMHQIKQNYKNINNYSR